MSRSKPASPSPLECILLILLGGLPVFFLGPATEPFEIPKLMLLEGCVLAIGAYRIAAGHPRRPAAKRWNPLSVSILVFLGSAVLSTRLSPNPLSSLYGAPLSRAGLLTAAGTAAVFFTARAAVRDIASWTRLAAVVSAAAATTAAYALLQALELDPLRWEGTATFAGNLRVFGTLGHPNLLGAYLGMALPLVVWLGLRVRGAGWRISLGVTAALCVGATVATLSRGAWGGLLAAAVVGSVLAVRARGGSGSVGPRRARVFWGSALAGLLIVAGLYTGSGLYRAPLSARAAQITDLSAPTTQSRLELWRAGLGMFADHPIAGLGLDAFGLAFPRYRTADYWRLEWRVDPVKAHSEPIQVLATQGLLGGAAAAAVVLLVSGALWRASRRGGPGVRTAAAAAGGSLAAFVVTGLVGFTVLATGTLAAALAGAASAAGSDARPEPAPRVAGGILIGLTGLAIGVFLFLAIPPFVADMDYTRAMAHPLGSARRAEWLLQAEERASWDPRYPFELGRSHLAAARLARGVTERRALLRSAERESRRAIARSPLDGAAHLEHARALAALGSIDNGAAPWSTAREEVSRAIELDPENVRVLIGAAETWLTMGRPQEARSMALEADRLYPEFGKPLAFVGYVALRTERFQDGIDTLKIALARDFRGDRDALANAWSNLSAAYFALGKATEAREAALRALEVDPDHGAARRILTNAARFLHRPSPSGRMPAAGGS